MKKFMQGMKPALIGMTVMTSMLTTGCFDRQELEQQAFVTEMAIDKAPGNLIDCTMRIALPKGPSSGGGGGGGSSEPPLAASSPITVRAHTIMEAFLLANASIERKITLTHLTSVMFGEDLAKVGLAKQLQPMVRFREFRRTVYLNVAKGKAGEILQANKPMLEPSMNKMADDIDTVAQRVGIIPVHNHLHDFANAVEIEHEDPVLPVYALNPGAKSTSDGSGIQSKKVSYDAGDIPRSGGNPVEWAGTAVFHKDKLVGYLSGRQTIYLRMLQGSIKRTNIDFPDPYHPKDHVGLSVRIEHSPTYHIQLSNPMQVRIELPLDAELVNSESGVDYTYPGNRQRLEASVGKSLSKDMRQLCTTLFQTYQVDCIPLSLYARPQFATHRAYALYPWEQRLRHAQVTIEPAVHVRRYGVQLTPLGTNS